MDQQIPWGEIASGTEELQISLLSGQTVSISRGKKTLSIIQRSPDGGEDIQRFITGSDDTLCLVPALPELPVIISSTEKLGILPNQKLDVFVEIPLLLNLCSEPEGNRICLWETPFAPLSRSFFGTPDNGEIAYSLGTPLHRNVSHYTETATNAYCPLTIINKSGQILDFHRMILRVPYLTLYQGKDRIYASPVSITFRGADQVSQVQIRKQPPESAPPLKQIAPPRSLEEKSVLKKSFVFFRNLYNG